MRPVNKGKAPDIEFKKYRDAMPYMEERVGAYCSYCELPLQHVPEIDHIESKSKGGELLKWDNFLISCKYCNTRKSNLVAAEDKNKYLWPDIDDIFHAYTYKNAIPEVNDEYLETQGDGMKAKAHHLFKLLRLGEQPTLTKKDRRFYYRLEAFNCAKNSRENWEKAKESTLKNEYLKAIEDMSKGTGFFSVWMEVFSGEKEVQQMLINSIPGTRKEVFD